MLGRQGSRPEHGVTCRYVQSMSWARSFNDLTSVGFNVTSSEMGHLYYEELGNQPHFGLQYTGDFDNLLAASWYWSGTDYGKMGSANAWRFAMNFGNQNPLTTRVPMVTG